MRTALTKQVAQAVKATSNSSLPSPIPPQLCTCVISQELSGRQRVDKYLLLKRVVGETEGRQIVAPLIYLVNAEVSPELLESLGGVVPELEGLLQLVRRCRQPPRRPRRRKRVLVHLHIEKVNVSGRYGDLCRYHVGEVQTRHGTNHVPREKHFQSSLTSLNLAISTLPLPLSIYPPPTDYGHA